MDSISFQPVISPIALAILLTIAVGLLWIRPAFASATPGRTRVLSAIRFCTLLLLGLGLVRPGCVQKTERHQAAVLMFLIDATRSMEHPHLEDQSTRWSAAIGLLKENESRFEQLENKKIDVKAFTFDRQTNPIEWTEDGFALPAEPTGSETDIGSAIYDVSLEARDQRLLGVILASDGVQNTLDPPIELTRATEVLRDLEVPLYGLPFGLPGDAGQLADVSVKNLAEQHIVNVKNDLSVRAGIVVRGYPNQDIPVELWLIDAAGNEERVATEIIRPDASYDEINVELKYRPTEPGEYRLKVRAVSMPGEVATRNNELDAFLTVNDKGMRVLYVVGDLGFEQSFLRRALAVNDFIQLDFKPIYANTRDAWPDTSLEKAFRDPTYDVFILGDLDSRALYDKRTHAQSLNALVQSVESGKGLLMLGGPHSFGAGLYQRTPLADVLPIKMDATESQDFGKPVRRDLHINREIKIKPTKDHYLTRLTSADGANLWSELPELPGANRFVGVKDNAEVLLATTEGNNPLLVTANVGGRVAAFAGDQTWRWRMAGFGDGYEQFWRQVVLWLAFWDARTDQSVNIELPQRRFSAGASIKFGVTVQSIGTDSSDIGDTVAQAQLVKPDGSTEVVAITPTSDGFRGTIESESTSAPGLYRLEAAASREDQTLGMAQREFVVMDRDREKSNPAANPDLIIRLANETKEFGGAAIEPERLSELLDELIANPPMTKIEVPTTWRLGETFNDAAAFLCVFVAMLGIEWWLRKKWGMV
jgi:uncharacterized membrane protein